jgi:hypothetical protein
VNPEQMLQAGAAILGETLARHGFRFVLGEIGSGSGGNFASGAFVNGQRTLELHFRHTLGLVTYHVGRASLGHEDYMRAAGAGQDRRYPGFAEDPLQGFRDLQYDLEHHGRAFVSGSDAEFDECVRWVAAHPLPSGLARLSRGGAA